MHIHDDLTERAVVRTDALHWTSSPRPGVDRRLIERSGHEVARATSIVRYAPHSGFPAHTHGGGEEFLVLAGTFSDEHGNYPAGAYVRNPPGSRHAPFTESGCTIFVKLWWTDAVDDRPVRIDTGDSALWHHGILPGIDMLPLHRFEERHTMLCRLDAGAVLPARTDHDGEEMLVLGGTARDALGAYPVGTWLRQPPGASPALAAATACRVLIKRGHLSRPPAGPTLNRVATRQDEMETSA